MLEDHYGQIAPVIDVLGVGATHLIIGKSAVELEKAIRGVLEGGLVGGVRMHPSGKGVVGNLSPKVNGISDKVSGVDFGSTVNHPDTVHCMGSQKRKKWVYSTAKS